MSIIFKKGDNVMKKRLIVCMSVSILMSMIFSSSIYAYDDYNQLSIQLDQPVLYQEKRDDLVVMNNNELSEDEEKIILIKIDTLIHTINLFFITLSPFLKIILI